MTAIEVSFLTGRYSATAHHDRQEPEWPPHGARLYSAMVAAWADAAAPDEAERAALEWVEALPPPRITAPAAVPRRVVSHFVPVNDASVIRQGQYQRRASEMEKLLERFDSELDASRGEVTKQAERLQDKVAAKRDVDSLTGTVGNTSVDSALELLPDGRVKKERYFPSVTLVGSLDGPGPSNDRRPEPPAATRVPPVVYVWDDAAPPETANALDGLLDRVTRLGHSSSLVSCRLRDEVPAATHLPGEGERMLRWVRPGQLAALEDEHARHQAVRPRSLPFRGVRYREVVTGEGGSVDPLPAHTAGDWIVFELEPASRRMPMTRTVELTRVLREAVLSHVSDPLPEGVSGHRHDGRPTTVPHIGFLALPNVGYEHSDGRIMGLAVFVPHDLGKAARIATLRGIGVWEQQRGGRPLQLRMGRGGTVEMRRRQPPLNLVSLRQTAWGRPSRWWVSAVPVALPANPGDLGRGTPAARAKAWARAEAAVAKSCEHVGLPRPAQVRVSLVSNLAGARPARDYPLFKQGRGGRAGVVRRLVHAAVEFEAEVRGPLILGSGRFRGLGLMRPVDNSVRGETDRIEEASDE
jgi:CRISPR-associated protein Csb2